MAPGHLLQMAADLVEINPGRPRRAYLCRAVSTVYYALFHCLARSCADFERLGGTSAWLPGPPKRPEGH